MDTSGWLHNPMIKIQRMDWMWWHGLRRKIIIIIISTGEVYPPMLFCCKFHVSWSGVRVIDRPQVIRLSPFYPIPNRRCTAPWLCRPLATSSWPPTGHGRKKKIQRNSPAVVQASVSVERNRYGSAWRVAERAASWPRALPSPLLKKSSPTLLTLRFVFSFLFFFSLSVLILCFEEMIDRCIQHVSSNKHSLFAVLGIIIFSNCFTWVFLSFTEA